MSVDDQDDAHFAMISWGGAGLRVFDIRDPYVPGGPQEVAYFNRGSVGVPAYDADRGLVYVSGRVLALGLPHPTDADYPRYPNGRPATP